MSLLSSGIVVLTWSCEIIYWLREIVKFVEDGSNRHVIEKERNVIMSFKM